MPRIHWAYHAVAICSALVAGLFFSPGYGQEPEIRHVELDAKAAEAQLRRQPGWVRISRDELERTLAAIRQRQQTVTPQIVHAEYQARWEDRALVGETRWQVWVAEAEKTASPNQVEPSATIPVHARLVAVATVFAGTSLAGPGQWSTHTRWWHG
jgi:hypothetical protein